MESERLLELILDVGTGLIQSGGETHRVEDTMYRMAYSFGFQKCSFWVVPSNIQATLTDPAGNLLTQTRQVPGTGNNFDRLDRLNSLSRWACAEKPSVEQLSVRLAEILDRPPQHWWRTYLGGILAGVGFGIFFGCDWVDAFVTLLASTMVTYLVRKLSRHETNPLILNFVISFLAELLILFCSHIGLGNHTGYITVGMVMLLISGLGATNGLRDLVHLDTLSGVMNIAVSFTGAIGIALGIALPLLIFPTWGSNEVLQLNQNIPLQIFSGTVACVGFALWFQISGVRVFYCAIGAALTWTVYLITHGAGGSNFASTLAAAVFCGLYAQVMARVNKTPATIFSTICIFTIIPGASLYYAMYGIVTRNRDFAYTQGLSLAATCFGIVLGYMIVEVVNRFLWRQHKH